MFRKILGFLLVTLVQMYDAHAAGKPALACCYSNFSSGGCGYGDGTLTSAACSSWCRSMVYNGTIAAGNTYGTITALGGCNYYAACVCSNAANWTSDTTCAGGCSNTYYVLTGNGYWSAGAIAQPITSFIVYGCTATKCAEGTWKTNTGSRIASLQPSYCSAGNCVSSLTVAAKCAVGYYGTLNSNWGRTAFVTQYNNYYTQCTRCSSYKTGVYGQTASVGTSYSTGCYIPSGTTGLTDTYGTYTAGANCPWN